LELLLELINLAFVHVDDPVGLDEFDLRGEQSTSSSLLRAVVARISRITLSFFSSSFSSRSISRRHSPTSFDTSLLLIVVHAFSILLRKR
jgi:hypothetical protein